MLTSSPADDRMCGARQSGQGEEAGLRNPDGAHCRNVVGGILPVLASILSLWDL